MTRISLKVFRISLPFIAVSVPLRITRIQLNVAGDRMPRKVTFVTSYSLQQVTSSPCPTPGRLGLSSKGNDDWKTVMQFSAEFAAPVHKCAERCNLVLSAFVTFHLFVQF